MKSIFSLSHMVRAFIRVGFGMRPSFTSVSKRVDDTPMYAAACWDIIRVVGVKSATHLADYRLLLALSQLQ
jgi:hypothetical protein